jgi:hypothetical protein
MSVLKWRLECLFFQPDRLPAAESTHLIDVYRSHRQRMSCHSKRLVDGVIFQWPDVADSFRELGLACPRINVFPNLVPSPARSADGLPRAGNHGTRAVGLPRGSESYQSMGRAQRAFFQDTGIMRPDDAVFQPISPGRPIPDAFAREGRVGAVRPAITSLFAFLPGTETWPGLDSLPSILMRWVYVGRIPGK